MVILTIPLFVMATFTVLVDGPGAARPGQIRLGTRVELPVPQGSGHDRASHPRALDGLLRRPYQRQPAAGSAATVAAEGNELGRRPGTGQAMD